MRRISLWLSPWETYSTPERLAADVATVHLPGHATEVLIPTVYDDFPQSGLRNNLGPALKVSSPEHAAQVRAEIEAHGVLCGGWSVPRGTGDARAEGWIHGTFASAFDHFNLNWEEGWQDFWARDGEAPVRDFLTGFWNALASRGRSDSITVGITFVPNTAMLGSATPDETAAWVEGSHYVAIEVYVPGDPGLDPVFGTARMRQEMIEAGHPDFPIVCLLERGDLPTLAAQRSNDTYGVQVWTVGAALQHTWPEAEEQEEPEVTDEERIQMQEKIDGLVNALGYVAGDALRPLTRKTAAKYVQTYVAEARRVADQVGVGHA